jgi:hypothetical protein
LNERIDCRNHAGLTVVFNRLSAVDPDGRCIVHSDREGGARWRIFGWYETGEKTAIKRMARVGEGGLNDGMVLHLVLAYCIALLM